WFGAVRRRGAAEGADVDVTHSAQVATTTGWPLFLVDAVVRTGGAVIERRLAAFYLFGELGADALLRVPPALGDAARIELRAGVVERLLAARPEYDAGAVSVEAFWAGAGDEA